MRYMKVITGFMCLAVAVSATSFAYAYDAEKAYKAWVTIGRIEQTEGIPKGLLHSISLVESGQGLEGSILPWPYTIGLNSPGYTEVSSLDNLEEMVDYYEDLGFSRFDLDMDGEIYPGKGSFEVISLAKEQLPIMLRIKPLHASHRFTSQETAAEFAEKLLQGNYDNFDIGLMQVNWHYHKDGFTSVSEALDGYRNAKYAVSYLQKHHAKNKTWWETVGRYHSGTPKHAEKYIRSVWVMYKKIHRLNTKV